ncbi:hypothetical protein [Paenarthrobacter nitroguajacolicus]|uniref:hypothetical protein n=1 Tax=Paenarthrobacter nitroguajacolicus TaxID=211146 RepID=UPI0028622388|nr:hypothetical protein [Paenarthrobacter nitroguajacolicus]MDR6639081.1 hypothetical protein [Paenarthrobacter nitroguajacolicus]
MRRVSLLTFLALVILGSTVGCSAGTGRASPAPMAFGVLGSSCSPDRLAALRTAGVSVVELPLAWDRYEPVEGRVDSRYVAEVQARLDACRQAGMGVVLSPGLHYAPNWVRRLAGGVLKGSSGGVARHGGAELIFSAATRDAAQRYLARVASDLGLEHITAIRVGTDASGELGYPGPEDGGNEGEFWAFGDAPQLGIGLAEGVVRSPMPGWVPGSRSWNGRVVTPQQVRNWWDWYAGSAVDAVVWQVGELRKLGYEGLIHVPVAGRGALPADVVQAVDGRLDGRANPDGALERGLDYVAQFAVLAALPGVAIDFTGLDDVSDVWARTADPPQDRCRPGDETGVVRDDVSEWSSHRYTSALARRAGLGLVGENPGPPDAPFTGGSPFSHSLADQLRLAPEYAAECGMTMFLFGFEEDLFRGKNRAGNGVGVDDYGRMIQQLRADGR